MIGATDTSAARREKEIVGGRTRFLLSSANDVVTTGDTLNRALQFPLWAVHWCISMATDERILDTM